MNSRIHRLIIALSIASSFGASSALSATLKIGEKAPAFELTDAKGKTHDLKKYLGKTVVLEWLNYGCPFVKKHYNSKNMQGLQKRYTDKKVVWLSVVSSAKGKQGFAEAPEMDKLNQEKGNAASAVLLDPSGKVGKLYGAKTTPHLYVVNKKGVLVYQGAIDDHPSTDEDDIKGSKNFISEALDQTLAGKPILVTETEPYGCSVKYAD
jgi:peroxiredoxin